MLYSDVIPPPPTTGNSTSKKHVRISTNFRRGQDSHGACDDPGPPLHSKQLLLTMHTTAGIAKPSEYCWQCCGCYELKRQRANAGTSNSVADGRVYDGPKAQTIYHIPVHLSHFQRIVFRREGFRPSHKATKLHIPTHNLHCQKLHIVSNGLAPTRLLELYTIMLHVSTHCDITGRQGPNTHTPNRLHKSALMQFTEIRRKQYT